MHGWLFRLRAHGNVFERFRLCFHAKTGANTNNLLQKLELIQYIENISLGPCKQGVKTIKEMKTFLKTLGNDARVHIALIHVHDQSFIHNMYI